MFILNLTIAGLCATGAGVLFFDYQSPSLALAYFGFGVGYLGLALAA